LNASLSFIIDLTILGALGAAIFYARRLSRQFGEMQADRKAFEKLIEAINSAAARADHATKALKEAAQQGGDRLQERISAARGLADELEIIVEAGDHLAKRLETLAERRPPAAPAAPESAPDEDRRQPRTRAEKELLEALRAKQQS
jgi:hypothetical protein